MNLHKIVLRELSEANENISAIPDVRIVIESPPESFLVIARPHKRTHIRLVRKISVSPLGRQGESEYGTSNYSAD